MQCLSPRMKSARCACTCEALLWERSHNLDLRVSVRDSLQQSYGRSVHLQSSHGSTQKAVRGMVARTVGGTQSASFRDAAGSECAFPLTRDPRVRFSVECAFSDWANAAAPPRRHGHHRRPRKAHSVPGLHEKYSLPRGVDPSPQSRFFVECAFLTCANVKSSHGKAHSALGLVKAHSVRRVSRKGALWPRLTEKRSLQPHVAQTAPFSHVAAREAQDATPPGCGAPHGIYGPTGQNAFEQPPARLRGVARSASLGFGLTAGGASRTDAPRDAMFPIR